MKNNIAIANDILLDMSDLLSSEQIDKLSQSLSENLKDAIVINDQKRCETLEETYQIIDKFIDFKKLCNLSEKTLIAYRNYITAFFRYSQTALFYVTEEEIQEYLAYKLKTISPTSVNNIRRSLSSFFNWCFDFKYVVKNPLTKNLVPQIKCASVLRNDINANDLIKIKDACYTIQDPLKRARSIALVDFLESTGCRVSEIAALQVSDIDFDRKRAKIHGKGDKERWVYLNAPCSKHLKEYFLVKKNMNKESEYAFSNIRQDKIHKEMNLHIIEKITKDLGTICEMDNDLTVHKFRRYFATSNYRKGINPDSLRILMGHSKYQTTLRYIAQDADEALQDVDKLFY